MPYVRVFYQKCPTCGQTWSTQLSQADVIRLGKEHFVCKCGIEWPTKHIEWAHLTPAQRRSYFLSTAEIGVLILAPLTGGLFTLFIARKPWLGLLSGLAGGLVVAALFVAAMWSLKYVFVKLSLRRCPFDQFATPFAYGFWEQFRGDGRMLRTRQNLRAKIVSQRNSSESPGHPGFSWFWRRYPCPSFGTRGRFSSSVWSCLQEPCEAGTS